MEGRHPDRGDPREAAGSLKAEDHPLLRFEAFRTDFPARLGDLPSPPNVTRLLALDAEAPFERDEDVRKAVRDLLRHGGYKPTGRGKPASEYLVRAATEQVLQPINLAVDACNAVSLHSGLPISVVDADKAKPPLKIAIAPEGARYVFNASGQEIDLKGLLCLFDADGPCGNAVKDSQRTKTDENTTATISIVWGCVGHEDRLARATEWYRRLLEEAGAKTGEADPDG